MKLKVQKRLAAALKKCSPKRIKFDNSRLEEIKESITKTDLRGLIADGAIKATQKKGVSRVRANKRQEQKKKGRRKGHGSRKGTQNARNPKKTVWMNKIRIQREFLKKIKESGLINSQTYRGLYLKAKGGFFRSKNHLKLYLQEHNILTKQEK